MRACSILRLTLVPGGFCDRSGGVKGRVAIAERRPEGPPLTDPVESGHWGAGEGKSVGDASVVVIGVGEVDVLGCLLPRGWVLLGRVGGVGRTGWQIEVGNHAYLGARTCPCWSGHMMMMGSLSPRLGLPLGGSATVQTTQAARDAVPALQEPW